MITLNRYHICFWFSEETCKNDLPDYHGVMDAESLDLAVVQAMQQCRIASVVNVLWWQVSPMDDTQVLAGNWRFYVSLENPVGMYAE